jgi:hypothetical protein
VQLAENKERERERGGDMNYGEIIRAIRRNISMDVELKCVKFQIKNVICQQILFIAEIFKRKK